MGFIRTPLPASSATDDPTLLCTGLHPGTWLIEAGCHPPAAHEPRRLLPGAMPELGIALSLPSARAIQLNLGPLLVTRLAELGCALDPLAGLALHELVVNAILHGNLEVGSGPSAAWGDFALRHAAIEAALDDHARAARLVTIMLAWDARRAVAAIADEGSGYNASTPVAPVNGAGRGLAIARAAGELAISADGRQATLTLPRLGGAAIP